MKLEKTHDAVIFWYRLTSVLPHLKEEAVWHCSVSLFFIWLYFCESQVISLGFILRQGDVASHTNPLTYWLRCWDSNAVRAGGVWWERHVRSWFLMDWNAVTLKTFDPDPPKNLLPLERMWLRLPPFLSLPPSPERLWREALCLLHVCCVGWNSISICTLCPTHVLVLQNMLYNGERSNCFSVCIEQILALHFVHIPHSNTGRILL